MIRYISTTLYQHYVYTPVCGTTRPFRGCEALITHQESRHRESRHRMGIWGCGDVGYRVWGVQEYGGAGIQGYMGTVVWDMGIWGYRIYGMYMGTGV